MLENQHAWISQSHGVSDDPMPRRPDDPILNAKSVIAEKLQPVQSGLTVAKLIPIPCSLFYRSFGAKRAPYTRIAPESAAAIYVTENAVGKELLSEMAPISVGENASPSR